MKTLGLTGGLGMGKSTAAEFLRQRGVPVADSDAIARQLTAPGQPLLADIRAAFGPAVFRPDGALDRAALAELVFAHADSRHRLEAILHPPIRSAWQAQLADWRQAGRPLAAVVIPLLFEIGAQAEFDITVAVACSAATQLQRLRSRGWTDAQIRQRNQAQLPVERKLALARYALWNEGDAAVLAAQLDRVLFAGKRPWECLVPSEAECGRSNGWSGGEGTSSRQWDG